METAVFLGAGASKALGLPLTADILPEMLARLYEHKLFGRDQVDCERLSECLKAVLPGLAGNLRAARHQLPSVTDVLSSIDFLLETSNTPGPGFSAASLRRGRTLLERAIFELLMRDAEMDTDSPSAVPQEHVQLLREVPVQQFLGERSREDRQELERMVGWILQLAGQGKVTVISTNYDVELEQELYRRLSYDVFGQVDFGTSVRDPGAGTVHERPENAALAVYKLHGSLNWLRCDLCDMIYVNPLGSIAYLSFLLGDDPERHKERFGWLRDLETAGADECHCAHRPLRHMIVAPSFVRDVRDPVLLEIWRNSLSALRRADQWVIVGYSLPPEDLAIRSMFLRARAGRDSRRGVELIVVQPQAKEPEVPRYEMLLPGHRYVEGGLAGYLARADT